MFALTADCNAFVPTMANCTVEDKAYKLLENDCIHRSIRCIHRSIRCIHHAICFAVVFEGQR